VLEAALTPAERAVATAFQRLFEENLYWAVVHTRWVQPAGWTLTQPAFFGAMPISLRWIVPPLARRGLRAELHGHGMGRHSAAEIHAIGCRDITAVADLLADKPFMLGAQPTSLDATAYAFLANVLWAPLDSPICDTARARPALQAFLRAHQGTLLRLKRCAGGSPPHTLILGCSATSRRPGRHAAARPCPPSSRCRSWSGR
jgi:glutathione S-transferase